MRNYCELAQKECNRGSCMYCPYIEAVNDAANTLGVGDGDENNINP